MTVDRLTYESLRAPLEENYIKWVILSCIIGNAFEPYDFVLYGYFATTIRQLFPNHNAVSALFLGLASLISARTLFFMENRYKASLI